MFIQQRAVVPENEGGNLDESALSSVQNPPAPTPRRIQGGDGIPPSPQGIEDRRQFFGASSVKDLEEKAKLK